MQEVSYDKKENQLIIAVLLNEVEKFKKNNNNSNILDRTWEKIQGDNHLKREHVKKIYNRLLNDGVIKIRIDKEALHESLSFILDENKMKEMRMLFFQDARLHAVFNDRFPDVELKAYLNQDEMFYHLGLDLVNTIHDNPTREVWIYHGSTLSDFAAAFNLSDFHLNKPGRIVIEKSGTEINGDKYGVFVPTVGNLITYKCSDNACLMRESSNAIAAVMNEKLYGEAKGTLHICAPAFAPLVNEIKVDMDGVLRYFQSFPIYKRIFSPSVFPHTLLFSVGGIAISDPSNLSFFRYNILNPEEQNALQSSGADAEVFASFFKCMDEAPYQIKKYIVPLSENNPYLRGINEKYLGLGILQATKIAENHILTKQGLGNVCVLRDTDGIDCSYKIRSLMAALSMRLEEGPLINRVYLTRKCYLELAKWFTD